MIWHLNHPHDFFILGIVIGVLASTYIVMMVMLVRIGRNERRG